MKEKEEKKETSKTKKKNLNESIIAIRNKLQNTNINKSGQNKFAEFKYFELADFLPTLNSLMLEENVNDVFTIENGDAKLILIKGAETQEYKIPFTIFETPINKNGQKSMQDIQYLGALNTYYKRYLYLNAFGITDGEVIDSMDNNELNIANKLDKLKEKIKKYPNALEVVKKHGKKLSECSEDELKEIVKELEGEEN